MNEQKLPMISASKLKTFRTCQRKYYYKYLLPYKDRPDDEPNASGITGGAIHKVISNYYRGKILPFNPPFELQKYILEEIERVEELNKTIKGGEWLSSGLADGKKMLALFDWNRWKPLEIEYEFNLPFPSVTNPIANIIGYIDLIDASEVVVDWKSSKAMPTLTDLANDPQFILYAWAYRELYGKLPKDIIWYHLRNGRSISVPILNDIDWLIEGLVYEVEALLKSVPALSDNPRRMLDKVCLTQCAFFDKCFIKPKKEDE